MTLGEYEVRIYLVISNLDQVCNSFLLKHCQLEMRDYAIHNIQQSKLFVVQTLLEFPELQNYWGSNVHDMSKESLEVRDESWIIKSLDMRLSWFARRNKFECCVQSWDSGLPVSKNLWIISYRSRDICIWNLFEESHQFMKKKSSVLICTIY